MSLDQIYNSSALYSDYKKNSFKRNCRNLQKAITEEQKKVDFDHQAVARFPPRQSLTERGYPFWDRSEAQRVLKLELASGQIANLKPSTVYIRNNEYQKFPLAVFRNHLYKEQSRLKTTAYWQVQRKRKNTKNI